MTSQMLQLQVPVPLLLTPQLAASAKLIWMVSRLGPGTCPAGTAPLASASGLSSRTVLRALPGLRAAGWALSDSPAPGPAVPVPAGLLTNRKLSPYARVLYGLLLLTPGFQHPSGHFTHAELAALAHASPTTIIKALSELARVEWIIPSRQNRLARVHFELTFPGFARGLSAMDAAQHRLQKPGHHGEKLMREYLSLLIDSDEFEDDAAPGYLTNPRTQERLQFDRYYPPGVAWEFNGPHHYRKTATISAGESVAQQERDLIKKGICLTRGISLVTVHEDDLTLDRMRQKVGTLLPLRDLTAYDLLIDYLEAESRQYRRNAAKR